VLLIQTMCVCLYVFGLAGKTVHTKQQMSTDTDLSNKTFDCCILLNFQSVRLQPE